MPKEVLMRYAASAVLVLAMVALVTKLVLAPFHHVYTADECRAAYAEARTSMDSIAVDFKPFDDGDNAVDTRCKAVRPIRALSSSDILP
jgi:hypothetical protein